MSRCEVAPPTIRTSSAVAELSAALPPEDEDPTPSVDRLAAVRSASYHHGTGYFIGGGCVVTAAALVDRDSTCQVHPLDSEEWYAGHIVWRADDDTLALLDLRDPELRRFSNAWLGRLDTTAPVHCRILGFSGFAAARDDRRAIVDVEELSGEIQALTGPSERLTVRVGSTTPGLSRLPDLMSGAPVFVGTLLVGVVAGRERIDEALGVWRQRPSRTRGSSRRCGQPSG